MVGASNAYGVTGAAYGAAFGTSALLNTSCLDYNGPNAIEQASAHLSAGDVITTEVEYPEFADPGSNCVAGSNCSSCTGYMPMEWSSGEFDAIKAATALGRIVVEPAGNGSMDLDSSYYNNSFQRPWRDSGAIMVGAGNPVGDPKYSPWHGALCWSDYGSRVDVQGWGEDVTTLGYGIRFYPRQECGFTVYDNCNNNGTDPNQWYAACFNGTSSATPIVASAVADIQGIRKAESVPVLTPLQMRNLLNATGTREPVEPTNGTFHNIGPLPNLQAALNPTSRPAPIGSVVAARQSSNITSTFAIGADGAIYWRWVSGTGSWQGPTAITNPGVAPSDGALLAVKQASNMLDLYFVGYDGDLYVVYEMNDGSWSAPKPLTGTAFAPPGARLTA